VFLFHYTLFNQTHEEVYFRLLLFVYHNPRGRFCHVKMNDPLHRIIRDHYHYSKLTRLISFVFPPKRSKTQNPSENTPLRQISCTSSQVRIREGERMVWFQCEDCGEELKKPKLAAHFNRCSAYKVCFYQSLFDASSN
jgi:predicted RNA-binding Zn-ribbon protein involved in translation (DUF1610 family)